MFPYHPSVSVVFVGIFFSNIPSCSCCWMKMGSHCATGNSPRCEFLYETGPDASVQEECRNGQECSCSLEQTWAILSWHSYGAAAPTLYRYFNMCKLLIGCVWVWVFVCVNIIASSHSLTPFYFSFWNVTSVPFQSQSERVTQHHLTAAGGGGGSLQSSASVCPSLFKHPSMLVLSAMLSLMKKRKETAC